MKILSKPRPQLFRADWQLRYNHNEGKDEEILWMGLNINAIEVSTDMPECMEVEAIRHAMQDYSHLSALITYMIHGWPSTRAEVKEELKPYWPFRNDITVIDRITGKDEILYNGLNKP